MFGCGDGGGVGYEIRVAVRVRNGAGEEGSVATGFQLVLFNKISDRW